jgi:hypothetical protein
VAVRRIERCFKAVQQPRGPVVVADSWRSSVVGAGAGGSIEDDYLFFSGATLGLRPSGVNVESTGASNYAYGRRTTSPPNLQSSIVIAFTVDVVGGGTARGLFKSNENQDYSGLSASTSTSAQLVFVAGQAGTGTADRRTFTFSGTLTTGQFYVAALAIDDFASGRAFLNGTSVSLSYGGSSPSYLVGSGGVQLGRSLPSGVSTWRYMVGGIAAWATFLRPLTDAELFELSVNPWQLFRAPRRVIYSFPTSTGRPKIWTGNDWVKKPAKVWNGSAWVEKPVKVYNGSTWVTVS